MAFKVNDERFPPVEERPHWYRAIPFSGWVALVFYAGAVFFGMAWVSSLSFEADIVSAAAALSCLATGAMLGALSRIIRILRSIRDSLEAG